jgi:ribosomal subunit interface protein
VQPGDGVVRKLPPASADVDAEAPTGCARLNGETMQIPTQITLRHMAPSEALEARIREKAEKLPEFHGGVMRCHVVVEELALHHQQGRRFNVRVEVHVPGHEIAVNRDHDEDPYVAVRDAFDHAAEQLRELARRQRGEVKTH